MIEIPIKFWIMFGWKRIAKLESGKVPRVTYFYRRVNRKTTLSWKAITSHLRLICVCVAVFTLSFFLALISGDDSSFRQWTFPLDRETFLDWHQQKQFEDHSRSHSGWLCAKVFTIKILTIPHREVCQKILSARRNFLSSIVAIEWLRS